MKAAEMEIRPDFPLMKQNDIVNFYHLQMPRWLFSRPKYKTLSLESKVAYTFLLNRFQLSRLNGWLNTQGEVFVIFTRENLAEEMQISYKKAIACFKELVATDLIWEKRVGRGNANQIYLALVELSTADSRQHSVAPFGNEGARPAETAPQDGDATVGAMLPRPAESADQEKPIPPLLTCQNSTSAPEQTAYPDLPKAHPSKNDKKEIDQSDIKTVCPSVSQRESHMTDQPDDCPQDSLQLQQLLDSCELWVLPEDVQPLFRSAIERLFYSDRLKIGMAVLPRANVRSHLWSIDGMVLQDAYGKLRRNTGQKVKNSSAYVMVTLFNSIHECQSDLLVDPYLNSLEAARRVSREGASCC